MNSATSTSSIPQPTRSPTPPLVPADCLRDILMRRPYMRQRMPRRSPATNPVIAELVNTVVQARDRKRQLEEAMLNRRDVGQQTAEVEVAAGAAVHSETASEDGISAPKRVRREEDPSAQGTSDATTADSSTNVDHQDLPAPSSSPTSSGSSASASISQPLPATTISDAQRLAQRNQRRAARTRRIQQAETMRLHMEHHLPYLQQINGVVPTEHNCDIRCRHPTGPHSVSPTVAPHMHLRHPLAPPPPVPPAYPMYATFPTILSTTAQLVPVGMLGITAPAMMAVQAPTIAVPPQPASFQNIYGLPPGGVTISPMPHADYFASFLRSHQDLMLPSFERMGLDRHHMFAGLDLDVPIGASRMEIDSFTKSDAYKKEGDDEETCTVCLSNFEDGEKIRKLPCNHFFHSECIDKWLDINKRCPMCRDEIDRTRVDE